MNIILGATGQVGSAIVENLIEKKEPVRAVTRNAEKADGLRKKGTEVGIADYFDLKALKDAIKGGDLIFVLTPENGESEDVLGDTQTILENYRKVIETSAIKKVIGLSSIGAQYDSGTGNLLMSYMLEHAFIGMPLQQVFVRPAYYYSNWFMSLSMVKEKGILPTFYPPDLQIPMISPMDVASFVTDKIINGTNESEIYELIGPKAYSSNDVAHTFGEVLGRKVEARQIPREEWKETLQDFGFTKDAIRNFIEMMDVAIDGNAKPEGKGTRLVQLPTTLKQYFKENIT